MYMYIKNKSLYYYTQTQTVRRMKPSIKLRNSSVSQHIFIQPGLYLPIY